MAARARMPGFALTMGITLAVTGLLVVLPLAGLLVKSAQLTWPAFVEIVTAPRALAAFRLTFVAAFVAAAINAVFGFVVAWVLVRYTFPGKTLVDALVDLPFALPTAVAGLTLTALYAKTGALGAPLAQLGVTVAFAPLGVVVALTFIGLPFVVRAVQPVLEGLDQSVEEAALSLGASRAQAFVRVVFPALLPALLTGFSLAFARAVGEYGSVVFISGNIPGKTEIAPLLVVTKLEQYDYAGATAIALVMLSLSFALLLVTNALMRWSAHRLGRTA
jgi:sulfate transport system permease protein